MLTRAGNITGPDVYGILIFGVFSAIALVLLTLAILRRVPYIRDRLLTKPRFPRKWEATWEGHKITVKPWGNLLGTDGCEELVIDGVSVTDISNSEPVESEDLYSEVRHANAVRTVHAHIGRVAGHPWIGCIISVNGVVVGGDTDKILLT